MGLKKRDPLAPQRQKNGQSLSAEVNPTQSHRTHVTQKVTKKKKRSGRSSIKTADTYMSSHSLFSASHKSWALRYLTEIVGFFWEKEERLSGEIIPEGKRRKTNESHDLPSNTVPSSFLMTPGDTLVCKF